MNKSFKYSILAVLFCLSFLSITSSQAQAGGAIKITYDNDVKLNPVISGNTIVWLGNFNQYHNNCDLFAYDWTSDTVKQITNTNSVTALNSYSCSISGDKVVWTDDRNNPSNNDWGNYNIFMYDLSNGTETQITTEPSRIPCICGDKIVYLKFSDIYNSDVYMYDLTSKTETQISTSGKAGYPCISGNKIVWIDFLCTGTWDYTYYYNIYLYDIDTKTQTPIALGTDPIWNVLISENKIVWFNGKDNNFHVYDLTTQTESIVLTPEAAYPYSLSLSGNRMAWADAFTNNVDTPFDVQLYDLATNNATLIPTISEEMQTSTSGDRVVWSGADVGVIRKFDIFMYDINASLIAKIAPIPSIPVRDFPVVVAGAPLVFDGSASYDPNGGNISSYRWDFGDTVGFSFGTEMNHIFTTPDTYKVNLVVRNSAGDFGAATTTVVVESPEQAMDDLVVAVQDMNLAHGITNSLDVKLQNALNAREAQNINNRADAVNQLQAFVLSAQAQAGKMLTIDQANQLISFANQIIAALSQH